MSSQHLASRFAVPLTAEDSNIWVQLLPEFKAFDRAFLADVLVMNARSRVAAAPIYKEHIIMHARRMLTQGEQHRATFRNR